MNILFGNNNNVLNELHLAQEFLKNYCQNHIFHFTYFLEVTERSSKKTNCFVSATLKVHLFIQILHGIILLSITACV